MLKTASISKAGGAALLVLALIVGACSGAEDESGSSDIAGTCEVGTPDCQDTLGLDDGPDLPSDEPLFIDDGPTDGVSPDGQSGLLIGGGLTIPEALATGVLAVQGFYVDDGSAARLCELLAESFPPQCGGASIVVENLDPDSIDIQIEGDATWTNELVTVFGDIIDGVLVVASNVSG